MAFIIPGLVTAAVGVLLGLGWARGDIANLKADVHASTAPDPANMRQTVIVLSLTMCLSSVVWYAFITMLPKWLGRELGSILGEGLTSLGVVVTLVYLVGTFAQFIGGHFADRGSAKNVYVASFALKLAAFLIALAVSGWPVVLVAALVTIVFDIAAPVENVLIARYASARRRGLAYGVRHGIAIVAAPLGVQLVSWLYDETRGFSALLLALAMIALVIFLVALLLPQDRQDADTPRSAREQPVAGS
jgi:MFS family permease